MKPHSGSLWWFFCALVFKEIETFALEAITVKAVIQIILSSNKANPAPQALKVF